eukprot:gene1811-1839_t
MGVMASSEIGVFRICLAPDRDGRFGCKIIATPDATEPDAPINPTPTDPLTLETPTSPSRADRTDPPLATGRWGNGAWASPSASAPTAGWATVASSAPQEFPRPSGAIRSIYRPLDAPSCAPGLLAGLANVATLYRRLSGRSLADPASLKDLAGTIESFNACMAQWPNPDPPPAQLAEWAAAGRGVSAVRNQMGVDLLQPNAGPAVQAAIRERQSALATPIPPWMAQRAEVVTHWLELDQLAAALDLPTRGPGALDRLGAAARLIATARMPPCAFPTKAAACLAQTDNLNAIREGFGIDPRTPDGPARLQQAGAALRQNLASFPVAPPPASEAARGLTQAALLRLRQIDRSQAPGLGLHDVTAEASPALTAAPVVLDPEISCKLRGLAFKVESESMCCRCEIGRSETLPCLAKEHAVTHWVEKLMNDARDAMAQDHAGYLNRIRRKIYWKGRKELLHAPRTLGHVAAAHVPVVGPGVALVFNEAVKKAVKARQDWRRTRAATDAALQPTVDSLIRERSKEDAKTLIDVATHIDGNHPKLRSAADALMSAFNVYNIETDSSDVSNIVGNAEKLAAEIYNCEHYEVKLQAMIEVARRYLDEIEIHVENSRNTTIDIEQALMEDLENYNRELAPNAQHEVMGMVENQQFTFDERAHRL